MLYLFFQRIFPEGLFVHYLPTLFFCCFLFSFNFLRTTPFVSNSFKICRQAWFAIATSCRISLFLPHFCTGCRWEWWKGWWRDIRVFPCSLGFEWSAASHCVFSSLLHDVCCTLNFFINWILPVIWLIYVWHFASWLPNYLWHVSECKERQKWIFQKYDRKQRSWQG